MNPTEGREVWAAFHLLDRQIVDSADMPVGKVDDLEFQMPEDDGLPVLTDILCGHAALLGRLDRRLGTAGEMLRRVIRPDVDPGPARIPWSAVIDVATDVRLAGSGEGLEVSAVERWLARHVIGHLPGSGAARA